MQYYAIIWKNIKNIKNDPTQKKPKKPKKNLKKPKKTKKNQGPPYFSDSWARFFLVFLVFFWVASPHL